MSTTSRLEKAHANAQGSRQLYRVGAMTAGVYLLTAAFYIRGFQVYSRTTREVFAWLVVIPLLVLFYKGYQAVKHRADAASPRTIIAFAAIFSLLACFVFPFHSTDVFGYINRGWQQVHYHQNPYVFRVGDIPGWQQDPMIWEHWIYNPNPYGFLFSLLARLLCYVGGGNWLLTLALFKTLNLLAYAATAWLVWAGAKLLGQKRPVVALYSFLWNPLILMHHLANGHNDILIGCAVALSLYLAIRGAYLWIIPALVAATLLKYAPALLLPLALIFVVKHKGRRAAILSCFIGAVLGILICLPYLQDWRLLRLEEIRDNATLIDNSLHSFLIHIFENIARLVPPLAQFHELVNALIKNTLRAGFLLFLAVQIFRVPKSYPPRLLIEKSLLILFVLLCVVSSKFNAWYMGMILPLALFLEEEHWLRRLVLLITCAELLSLTFFKQAYMLNYFAMILVPAWIVFRQVRREKATSRAGGEPDAAGESETTGDGLPAAPSL